MYKDGNGINIDELGKFPTDAKNGLSVQVTLKMDHYKIQELIEGLKSLAFFNCIYLDDPQGLLFDFAGLFNDRKSSYFKTFGVWTMEKYQLQRSSSYQEAPVSIVVGNCIYPFTKTQLFTQSKLPKDLPIYLHFNIGELDVTPNREAILYNPKTDAAILQKAKDAVEELTTIITKQGSIDFPSLLDWYTYKKENRVMISLPLSQDIVYKMYIEASMLREWNIPNTCTIKGRSMPSGPIFTIMENLLEAHIPPHIIKARYERDANKFYSKINNNRYYTLITLIKKQKIITTEDIICKSILKDYLKDEYYSKTPCTYESYFILSRSKAAAALRSHLKIWLHLDTSYNHVCTRFILKELDFKTLVPNYNSDSIPTDYITKWEANKKAKSASTNTHSTPTIARKCVIYTLGKSEKWDYNLGSYGIISNSETYTVDSITKSGKLFVYTSNDNIEDLKCAYRIFIKALDLNVSTEFIYVAPSNIPTLASLSNTIDLDSYLYTRKNNTICNFIDIDWDKVSMLRSVKYAYWEKLVKEFPDLYTKISEYAEYYSSSSDLTSCRGKTEALLNDIIKKYKENNWVNPRIKELQADEDLFAFIQWSKYIHTDEHTLEIFADYVYRSNLGKMTKRAYDAYRNSKFYKSFIKL